MIIYIIISQICGPEIARAEHYQLRPSLKIPLFQESLLGPSIRHNLSLFQIL